MKIKALQYKGGGDGGQFNQMEMDIESGNDLEKIKEKYPCTAYVVQGTNFNFLKEFKNAVVDRGEKDERKSLSFYLLEQEKIPLLNGKYNNLGQLLRSIRTLLKNALNSGENNIYFIGSGKSDKMDIFKSLRDKAETVKETDASARGGKPRGTRHSRPGNIPSPLIEIPCDEEDERKLAQVYLGESDQIKMVRKLILRAATTRYPVLILGDTGTGKECVAQAIHAYSPRSNGRLIPVNCGAIPENLLESELFGYLKDSHSMAGKDKIGLWVLANDGTLFLDEIGDLALSHQAKILRALDAKEVWPIGATEPTKVNARILAATNRDLLKMVEQGQFREDLYFRLDGLTIRTPTLRSHPEDIPPLAQYFWKKRINKDVEKVAPLPQEILDELRCYPWPGNARELKMVLVKLRNLFGNSQLHLAQLRALFYYQGRFSPGQDKTGADPKGTFHIECLNHLRRVESAIKICEMTGRSILKDPKSDYQKNIFFQDSLQMRVDELEMFCKHPLLFHDDETFLTVHQFKGKMVYFQGLLQKDPKEAASFWRKDVIKEYNRALEALAEGMGHLLNNPI